MRLQIIDKKLVEGNTWALCKGNLLEYLQGLKTNFFEFSVQRKIVNNAYLDTIYNSVEKGEPFPPITLTYQGDKSGMFEGSYEKYSGVLAKVNEIQNATRAYML